jgi:hypothetical protein
MSETVSKLIFGKLEIIWDLEIVIWDFKLETRFCSVRP